MACFFNLQCVAQSSSWVRVPKRITMTMGGHCICDHVTSGAYLFTDSTLVRIYVGILVNLYQISFDDKTGPHFYPLAMLGGVLWCTGNILCVQIINRIGMGVGLLVWVRTV
jgi:hypothetical protein